jgi:uncharacterized protein (DUF58 family)
MIAEVASLFALSASKRDRVGAVLFDETLRTVIPPRLGWRHGLRVVREVLSSAPAGAGTALQEAARAAGRLLHRRGVVVVIADTGCELPRRELVALAGRHDVVVVRVGDPLLERGIAAAMPVVDAESLRRGIAAGRMRVHKGSVLPGVDIVDLSTAEDYLPAVRAMLERRENRRAR